MIPDRWTVIETLGASSLIGGIWSQWGPQWAAMALGLLLLGLSGFRAWRSAKR